jgi:hypothetical protein
MKELIEMVVDFEQDKTVFIWTQTDSRGAWSRVALEPSAAAAAAPAAGGAAAPAPLADGKFGDVLWRVSWSVAGNVLAVSSGAFSFPFSVFPSSPFLSSGAD